MSRRLNLFVIAIFGISIATALPLAPKDWGGFPAISPHLP